MAFRLNVYLAQWLSVLVLLSTFYAIFIREIHAACGLGDVWDPISGRCIDCTEVCRYNQNDPMCDKCVGSGENVVDWAAYGGNEQKLYEDLFKNYNMKVRPVWNSSHPIEVRLQITINQIVEVDERNQILTSNLWIEQHWEDQKLVWDPEAYDGITIIRVPATEIWVPDVTLYDNAAPIDYVAHSRLSNALVSFDGSVSLWSKPTIIKSRCKVNIKYFPFDMQMCSMKFGSWTYNKFQIHLIKKYEAPDLSEIIDNEQWDLKYALANRNQRKYKCCPEIYHDVTYWLGLKRKPLYYLINLMMPCALLSALSLLGFFMPYNVGVVKVSLSVTLILSLTVFLLIIANMMPKTSLEFPLIGQYFAATMVMIAISTASNVFVLNINEKGGHVHSKQVPKWIRRLFIERLAYILMVIPRPESNSGHDETDNENSYSPVSGNAPKQMVTFDLSGSRNGITATNHIVGSKLNQAMNPGPDMELMMTEMAGNDLSERRLARIEKTINEMCNHIKGLEAKKMKAAQIKNDWAVVARVLDRIFVIIFIIFSITSAVMLFSQQGEYKEAPGPYDYRTDSEIQ